MKNFIGKLLFWFIKDSLEEWNLEKAKQREIFYVRQCDYAADKRKLQIK